MYIAVVGADGDHHALDSQWYLGVLLAGIVAHIVLLYATVRRQQAADATAVGDAGSVTVEAGIVAWPDCGTANDADDRSCRGCATQLPHTGTHNQQNGGPQGSLFG